EGAGVGGGRVREPTCRVAVEDVGEQEPGGRAEPVPVVAYDATWRTRFDGERSQLEAAIGNWAVAGIHHVGSTAVPGLDAKPIVDILVGVRDLASSRSCFDPLAGLGYVYAPYRTEQMHWFCKPHPRRRTHHLHLVPAGSQRFHEELAFRDYLRAHPETAREYALLKRQLALKFKHRREAYTDAKAGFIREVIEHFPGEIRERSGS